MFTKTKPMIEGLSEREAVERLISQTGCAHNARAVVIYLTDLDDVSDP